MPPGSAAVCIRREICWRTPNAKVVVSPLPSSIPSSPRTEPRQPRHSGCKVADQLRPKLLKFAAFMDEADVLAYMHFPPAHWAKLHSTNLLERLNGEIKRRTDVVGIFPNKRHHAPGRSHPVGTERRVGRAAGMLHDAGNQRRSAIMLSSFCRSWQSENPASPAGERDGAKLLHHAMRHDRRLKPGAYAVHRRYLR